MLRNHITLIGNIGNNPFITNFDGGAKVARFDLATTNEKNGNQSVEWHKLFAWGNLAHFIENFAVKGKHVVISGKLVNRTYLNKKGQTRKITEVEIQHVIGL